jgi:putative DNA topoisomerase
MKSIIICLAATFISFAAFSQKAKQNSDTALKSYLTYSCSMHPQYVSNVPAKCPVCNADMTLSKKEQMKAEVVKLYTCPMDSVISTKPGKCPKCNMTMEEFKPKKKSGSN